MFSHLVTAAKGFLKRQDTEGASPDTILDNNPKMARVARRSSAAEKAESESTVIANGNGESLPSSAGNKGGKNNKRRRSGTQDNGVPDESQDGISGSEPAQKDSAGKGGHIRFGSEEPELPEEVETEKASETGLQQDEEEEDSDDDAPETVDNSAQLSKIKEQAQKREQARQREENLKKEKRKQLDEQRKLQAQLANKKKEVVGADDESESSATLQGSTTQDGRRSGLPAFLPDDILNAAPSTRPPTPPVDDVAPVQKKPNKLKFLDKVEKRPKDVKTDGATIRVLDDGPSRKKAKTALPPKSSKSGRNARDNWLKNSRSTAQVNGLRRTGGGVSSFVRK